MILCLDLDGCVVEYDFPRIVKEYFGVDLSPEKIFAYDLADVLGVSNDEINNMFYDQVWGEPQFVEDAIPTLKGWLDKNYVIGILSNRVKYMNIDGLIRWLTHYSIPYSFIIVKTGAKFDFHIDDSPAKLMSVDAKTKLLYNQPWNKRCLNVKRELKRVKNWQEIREIINGRNS